MDNQGLNRSQGGALAAELQAVVGEVVDWAQGVEPKRVLQSPSPGEWSVTQTLAHSVEFLRYWADQATYVAAHPGAPFGRTQDDPDRIAAVNQHGGDDLQEAIGQLRSAGSYAVETIRSLPDSAWTLTGVHPARGDFSAGQIVTEFMIHHLQAHLGQAQQAYGAVSGS